MKTEYIQTWPSGFDQYGNPYGLKSENEEQEIIQFDNENQKRNNMKLTTKAEMLQLIYAHGENRQPTIVRHEDPAHGWYQIPLALAKELQIDDKISSYSYMDAHFVYLEYDCDIMLLLNALELYPQTNRDNLVMFLDLVPTEFKEKSPIRKKERYMYNG